MVHASSTVVNFPPRTKLTGINAFHDRDCIDRAKFRFDLAFPLPEIFFEQFADAKITIREFSKLVPLGKDLFNIVKVGAFRADGLVNGTKITVAFHGDPEDWPLDLMQNFEHRLRVAGYGAIRYNRAEKPKCGACPARFEKKCRGFHDNHS